MIFISKRVVLFWATAGFGISLSTSCGMLDKHLALNQGSSDGAWIMKSSSLSQQAIGILQQSCASCHGMGGQGGISNITDPKALMGANLIKPGDPSNSTLITSITQRGMPPGTPLNHADLTTLESWITTEFVQAPGAVVPAPTAIPVPTSIPVTTPTPVSTASYAWIRANVIGPSCLSCHSGQGTYNGLLSWVTPGNPGASTLYTDIQSGRMPPNGTISSAKLNAIQAWISAGAPNN